MSSLEFLNDDKIEFFKEIIFYSSVLNQLMGHKLLCLFFSSIFSCLPKEYFHLLFPSWWCYFSMIFLLLVDSPFASTLFSFSVRAYFNLSSYLKIRAMFLLIAWAFHVPILLICFHSLECFHLINPNFWSVVFVF